MPRLAPILRLLAAVTTALLLRIGIAAFEIRIPDQGARWGIPYLAAFVTVQVLLPALVAAASLTAGPRPHRAEHPLVRAGLAVIWGTLYFVLSEQILYGPFAFAGPDVAAYARIAAILLVIATPIVMVQARRRHRPSAGMG